MLNQTQLKEWQDGLFKQAKIVMKRDGYHVPLAMIITTKELMRTTETQRFKVADLNILSKMDDKSQEEYEEAIRKGKPLSAQEIPSGTPVFITIPLFFTNKDRIGIALDLLRTESNLPPTSIQELEILVQELIKTGKEDFKLEEPFKAIAEVILRLAKIHDKDLQAYVLKQAISMSGAYAYCKIDEMYVKKSEIAKGQDLSGNEIKKERGQARDKMLREGISEDPERIEGLGVQLETTQLHRMLFASVTKEGGRDSKTKVIGFGETEELITTERDGASLSGRFVDLLKKAERLNPPTAKA